MLLHSRQNFMVLIFSNFRERQPQRQIQGA
uniref:DNA-directed RNA polymerase subunit n=1 Tax=Rhizophora mucronata TaxID=61149 RepID=A0A2P2JFA0_RHIMU